ncbi:MAG: phosphonate C-P lyase system protein PhnG [Acidimicrobiia bacterium]|nr:phosphonate C-P lyase system protein PhnG [Acidimicrobiia bacterium]
MDPPARTEREQQARRRPTDDGRRNGGGWTREQRCELLAAAPPDDVIGLAERAVAEGSPPQLIVGPEVGTVVVQVREPVVGDRFHLTEVLATRAEIDLDGTRGWAMRLGDEPIPTLAAAVLDAEATARRPLADEVMALCDRVADERAAAEHQEWSVLAATTVQFEELDR